jgi:hypothetical protein
MKKFHHFISLSRNVKRMILLLADSILLISALWISFSLRLGILYFPEKSEICRQILRRQPKLLLLFDQNEFALYTIHSELLLLLNKLHWRKATGGQVLPFAYLTSTNDKINHD